MTGCRRRLLAAVAMFVAAAPGPAARADDVYGGATCGMVPLTSGSSEHTSEIDGGPFAVANSDGGTIHDVTITCTVQIDNPLNIGVGGTSRSSTMQGNVAVLVDTITFTAAAGSDVYLCTRFSWNSSKGHTDWYVDDDNDLTNGRQCALAGEAWREYR